MLLIIITILFFIYIKVGLLLVIQIVLWSLVFICSNFLVGINPLRIEYYVIRALSIMVIVFLVYINSSELLSSYTTMTFILPFCKDKISFYNDFPGDLDFDSTNLEKFEINEDSNLDAFLKTLSNTDNYVGFLEIKYSDKVYFLTYSELILFNKFSNFEVLEDFIADIVNTQLHKFLVENYLSNKLELCLLYTNIK